MFQGKAADLATDLRGILGRPKPGLCSLEDVLEELELRLRIESSFSAIPFKLSLSQGGDMLVVEVEETLARILKSGRGPDLIEVRVVNVGRDIRRIKFIAVIQLIGKAFSGEWILDCVILAKSEDGAVSAAKAPPDYWTRDLEEQLAHIILRSLRRGGEHD
ncbi:MAG: hypothetical protein ACTSXC_03580 [Candidatus Freyarchaeota archaeon]